tara:strand:- start:1071 stop:2261 length:1191 start_codon:yes stop_codon:yes gene_type:complete
MTYNLISQQDVSGKTLVVRIGIDSNVVDGSIVIGERLRQQANSLKQLAAKGAKIIALGHQGREGKTDFISLEQHAVSLAKHPGLDIAFVKWDENYLEKITGMHEGQVLLMDNVRFNKDETVEKSAIEHAKTKWVNDIAAKADFFVQNAFSVCHRSHASIVGFSPLLPSFAGPVLERELSALKELKTVGENRILVLGGAKPKDSVKLLEKMLEKEKVDTVLVGGLFAELFWKSFGKEFGAKDNFFKEKGLMDSLPQFKQLFSRFEEKIILPMDFAIENNGERKDVLIENLPSEFATMDIGNKTIELFGEKISASNSIVFNGPMGVYEQELFQKGTRSIFNAIAESNAFSLIGGGDTETALEKLGISPDSFNQVSLAGKALVAFLSGEQLPGLTVLEQ